MTNDELKKKIVETILRKVKAIQFARAEQIADALIAAGIGDVKEAEHRAEVAERALELMARGECTFASPEYYKKQAEKELAEEGKDE